MDLEADMKLCYQATSPKCLSLATLFNEKSVPFEKRGWMEVSDIA
jgi:hypothetical protein